MRSLLTCLFLIAALASNLFAATPAVFENAPTILVGPGNHLGIRAADFNHDQKLDFAVLDSDGNPRTLRLTVYLGIGAGTFSEPVVMTVTTSSTSAPDGGSFDVADLDGNQFPDLVVLYTPGTGPTQFQILLGKGDGAFETGATVASGAVCDSYAFALGDMTGDGRSDIISCDLRIFPSLGGGQFGAGIGGKPALDFEEIRLLDANGDGKRDVLAASKALFLGNGDGTLQPSIFLSSKGSGSNAVGDFDGNGRDDLTWIDDFYADRRVMLASQSGTYSEVTSAGVVNHHGEPAYLATPAMATPDLNGDARPDVITGIAGHLYVWLTLPDGSSSPSKVYLAGTGIAGIATGDFDADGNIDVLAAGATEVIGSQLVAVALIRGAGNGALHAERGYPLSHRLETGQFTGDPVEDLTLSDNTGDGLLDIVAVTQRNIVVLAGEAGGAFGAAVATPFGDESSRPAFGDLDGDGAVDVVLKTGGLQQTWLGRRDGTFLKAGELTSPGGNISFDPAIGDFNGDRQLDFVEIAGTEVHLHLGRGDGTFGPEIVTRSTAPATTIASEASSSGPDVLVADVNADGRDDIVMTNAVLLGLATGKFTAVLSDYRRAPLLADLDEDGKLDLILRDKPSFGGEVYVALGKGDGRFGWVSVLRLDTPDLFGAAVAADFDDDGHIDVAFGDAVLLGDGDGWFRGYARYRLLGHKSVASAGDVDRNGSSDLVVANVSAYAIDVIRTRTTISRELPLSLTLHASPTSNALGATFRVLAEARLTSTISTGGAVLFYFAGKLTAVGEPIGPFVNGTVQAVRVGTQPVTAVYGGDEIYASAVAPEVGTAEVSRGTTAITAAVSPATAPAGQVLRLTGFTHQTLVEPAAEGPISVVIDNVLRGTVNAPQFDLEIGPLAQGNHTALLQFKGDSNYLPAFLLGTFTVGNPPVNMIFSVNPPGVAEKGTPITLTVTFPNDPTLHGDVVFTTGSQTIDQQRMIDGKATVTTTLPLGSHDLRVRFLGNAQYIPTESAVVQYTVTNGPPRRRAARKP